MSRKKVIVCAVVAFVVGIAIGVAGTLCVISATRGGLQGAMVVGGAIYNMEDTEAVSPDVTAEPETDGIVRGGAIYNQADIGTVGDQ